MKLHYFKILLFFFPLNIFVTSTSYEHNKNKPYITTHHTRITTPRVLSEKDIQSSIYDKDEDIKSVKECFDRQTSQRFHEYDERMIKNRQKRKEERDKNIQNIILKDKMDKSLAEKVEKGCLRCGCALGGGVLPVWGLISGLWYATLSQYVTQEAIQKGIEAGISAAIDGVTTQFSLHSLGGKTLQEVITTELYKKPTFLVGKIVQEYYRMCDDGTVQDSAFGILKTTFSNREDMVIKSITESANNIALKAGQAAKDAETAAITANNSASTHLFSAIGYSVLAILIIVLVMIIIYLVLRYRRKKKMNKKAQYTKLLNQ
ncbi:rifin PIR protein, putative [Plasmodium reichenowi]|uniref:Rifin PIR protein, putative n=1 Tax=Plasmodium reichenowi TaxID=5854 RepID=A0A2P9D9D5_PLARE|nr:rifin PIR protein, putative [Plasmodium reichenowi]